jgi:hypothetical protein
VEQISFTDSFGILSDTANEELASNVCVGAVQNIFIKTNISKTCLYGNYL